MTEEQLQQSVNELDRDVEELRAWSKVEESARALREVIEKHPQSRAAAGGRSAIRIIDHGRSSNVPDSDLTPRPDPGPSADQPFGAGSPTQAPKQKFERGNDSFRRLRRSPFLRVRQKSSFSVGPLAGTIQVLSDPRDDKCLVVARGRSVGVRMELAAHRFDDLGRLRRAA